MTVLSDERRAELQAKRGAAIRSARFGKLGGNRVADVLDIEDRVDVDYDEVIQKTAHQSMRGA